MRPDPPHLGFARDRLMIMAAPNGARRDQADHPALPLRPAELAAEAARLLAVGVSVLHLHVRDAAGNHTLDVGCYREAISAVRAAVGERLVIQVTTEAVGVYSPAEQMSLVRELRPEAVSLALGELLPPDGSDGGALEFFRWLPDAAIWPQYILYTPEELRRWDGLRKRGVFGGETPSCLFVLGSYVQRRDGSLADLGRFLDAAQCSEFPWAACCFGPGEQEVMRAATAAGGHVRLGFENNLWLPGGRLAAGNAELVSAFMAGGGAGGRAPATAGEVREVFLPKPGRQSG